MYSIIDCDNCYVSCERVFRPDLKDKPVVVLSNNDGCVVARSNEAKKMGIKAWGEELHKKIKRNVGMPVSIGLAPNKTLAKMASHFAKKYQGYRHCCMIDSDEKRIKALKLYPIDEVWDIGRRYAARLEALGVKTAYDFAEHNQTWVKATFNNIVIKRTWRELNGEDCVPNEEMAKKKSICTSRSFNGMITDIDGINKVNGTETIVLGSQQYTQKDGKGKANVFANAIKHDFKSKNPTTRWSDIIVLK